ncbi:MAG: EAL domain-containing protein, partial [Candidatus Sumerlaeaceae bacterium]
LVVEIPEMLVTNDAALSALRERLGELNIQLAYDDFGAGQARLVELTRVPPEYLKFDKVLVGDLAKPGLRVRTILEMLITFAHDLGVKCVAEGVASHEVAAAACDVGFDLLQGHFFSKASALSTVTPLQPFG